MTDPPRLRDLDAGNYAAALIRAGQRETPRAAVRRASAVALGLLSAGPVAQAAASGLTGTSVVLAGTKGLLAGAIFSVAAAGVSRFGETPKTAHTPAELRRDASAQETAKRPKNGASRPVIATALPTSMATTAPIMEAERSQRRPDARTVEAASPAGKSLADETKAFGLAQRALERGDPAGALAALDAFERAFPRAVLAQEAEVLRIEALSASGRTDAAVARGRAFLAAHPHVPAARRIGSLVARIENAGRHDQTGSPHPLSATEAR